MKRIARTTALAAGSLLACLILAASALAATAAPIALDGPQNGNDPLVAYDPVSKATFVAWADPQSPDSGVEVCVLPAGATGCEGGAPVLLSVSSAQNPLITGDNTIGLGGLVVLPNGDVVVIGTPVLTGSVAWESDPTGAAFLTGGQGLQNGGAFVSPVSLFYAFNNAVALSNTDVGLLDDYGGYFSDSPFSGPESPAIAAPNSNQGHGGLYPRKALNASGPEIGAMPAPPPAATGTEIVVGVGDNFGGPNTTLPGCVNSAGTGYGVSAGLVNGTSKTAGTLNAAGLPGYGLLTCSAESPVLASGGADGIGELENEGNGISGAGTTYSLDFKPFAASATGGSFPTGPGTLVANLTNTAGDVDLADDSGAGVYAIWSSGGLHVDYSANGGATWGPPALIPQPASGAIGNPVIAGVGGGAFLLAYTNNPGTGTETFLQTLSYQQLLIAPSAVTTSQQSGSATGASLTIPGGTVGETDQATISGANAASASGSATYALFSSSSCSAGSLVFNGGTSPVTAGLAARSAAVTSALAPGTYYWLAAYTGNATNAPSLSTCGSEVLTIGPADTIGGGATSTSTTVTVTITCASTPCTVTITITIGGGAAGDLASAAKAKKVTLGAETFNVRHAGANKLAVKLNAAGKRLLKRDHGQLKALLTATRTIGGHKFVTTRTIEIKPHG